MRQLNIAEQIRAAIGITAVTTFKKATGEKMPQFTKKGPGRFHRQGKKQAA